jgi:hypothetical protein
MVEVYLAAPHEALGILIKLQPVPNGNLVLLVINEHLGKAAFRQAFLKCSRSNGVVYSIVSVENGSVTLKLPFLVTAELELA